MPREKALCGKEEIIRVAVRIVDEEGVGALSARRMAKELHVSPMTIYNYVENQKEIKKQVLISGFDRMYSAIYQALNNLETSVDKLTFCKTMAKEIFRFANENRNIFAFMFSEGRCQFIEDAEIRPFYSFIVKFARRSKITQKDYAANEKTYTLLEMLLFSVSYQCSAGIMSLTEGQFDELIYYFLEKCLS